MLSDKFVPQTDWSKQELFSFLRRSKRNPGCLVTLLIKFVFDMLYCSGQ